MRWSPKPISSEFVGSNPTWRAIISIIIKKIFNLIHYFSNLLGIYNFNTYICTELIFKTMKNLLHQRPQHQPRVVEWVNYVLKFS
jgi:hypothetical protein